MAATTTAHFEPTTDTFGRLTLKAHHGVQVLPANLLIVLAFFSVLILAITGLAFADKAAFEHNLPGTTYYGGVPLDYD
ncbi:hypothetical protein [Asticcacaulis sp.]|uniref:hypothetical protein n=1 Tax=Asticcacaulis sp. TaxID=1872648 RepID=UPI002C1070D3|nr:hypothetical protein [Asticcacaulis sp.]HTM82320.1 hypothetical protein [Asticcacaulis sp.]